MSDSALKIFEKLNEAVPVFARQLQAKLRGAAPQETGDGWESIRIYTGKRNGIVDKVSPRFTRYLIFREFGAGKGMAGSKGNSVWYTSKGERRRTNSASLGKMATGNRSARPWFNAIIKQEHPRLAQIVADTVSDGSISALKYWLLNGTQ